MLNYSVNIAISCTHSEQSAAAQQLAVKLQLPFISCDKTVIENTLEFLLIVTPQHLELRQNITQAPNPLVIDFLKGNLTIRSKRINTELLVKAVKIKSRQKLTIIDATAGLGRDAFILAQAGHKITLIERNPIIAALLADGIARLKLQQPEINMTLTETDAITYLNNLIPADFPDVIYLDPMFSDRIKTALVKKDMRFLQNLVGKDLDADNLFKLATQKIAYKVVVKRPAKAEFLGNTPPNYSINGKINRFDVYRMQER